MKLPRRKFLYLAAGAAALPPVSRIAWAQTYRRNAPDRATCMIEDTIDNVRGHTKACHASGCRTTQIVKDPGRNFSWQWFAGWYVERLAINPIIFRYIERLVSRPRHGLVDPLLSPGESTDWLISGGTENELVAYPW